MKKIVIQFHATLNELVEYANSVSSELGFVMTLMTLKPFTLRLLDSGLSVEDLNHCGGVRVIFTSTKPLTDSSTPNGFYDLNPGTIGLHVGRLTERGLEESSIAFVSDNHGQITAATKVATKLKKMTRSGAIAVNPVNGAEAVVRSHRYTAGAKALYEEGARILPAGGSAFYKLTD